MAKKKPTPPGKKGKRTPPPPINAKTVYCLVVGAPNTPDRCLSPTDEINIRKCLKPFPGFSIFYGRGYYDGAEENSVQIYLVTDDGKLVMRCAKQLINELKQQSVILINNSREVMFIEATAAQIKYWKHQKKIARLKATAAKRKVYIVPKHLIGKRASTAKAKK